MAEEFKLKALSIVLKRHSVPELKKMYREYFSEDPPGDISHLQLVRDLSTQTNFEELESTWTERLYASNTTIKTYRLLYGSERIRNGLAIIKNSFEADTWKTLCSEGLSLSVLRDEARLMHISTIGSKSYFLFVSPGRKKEVIENLVVKYLQQPQFTVGVWYNDDSILQVRGQEQSAQVVAKMEKYLTHSKNGVPSSIQSEITGKDKFNGLKIALKGRATKGRYSNPTDEVTEVTLKANPDKELLETARAKQLIKDKFKLNAAGIDFDYNKRSYTVWVGFKVGTFWLKSGDVTEDLLDYLQKKIFSVTKV